MKREVARFDFKAFGQAIKAARKAKGISRNQLADKMNIAPRYIASIENSGQHPSLQIFYELVTLLDVSVDQFFFPDKETDKSTQRRQLGGSSGSSLRRSSGAGSNGRCGNGRSSAGGTTAGSQSQSGNGQTSGSHKAAASNLFHIQTLLC